MRLNELQVNCLMAAASSREMVKREWLLDAMTITDRRSHEIEVKGDPSPGETIVVEEVNYDISLGQVIGINKKVVGIAYRSSGGQISIGILSTVKTPIYHRLDVFEFTPAVVKSFLGVNPCTNTPVGLTTVGRFLENIICLQYPTNFKFYPYKNEVMDGEKLLEMVTKDMVAKRIPVEEYRKFLDNFFYLNHITEISVPSMTERSLMTNPKVPEFKKKFIAEHADKMNDPLVIKEFEDGLAKLDKEYLGDDPSVTFFDGLGSKSYDIHRKKLFLTVGGIPRFDAKAGKFDFVEHSLAEGWTKEALPSIANEIRKGSYERGKETAKGGAETKLVMRVFQDLTISKNDCGTKRTIKINLGGVCRAKDFIGRTIRVGNVDVLLTDENISKFDGKVVDMYSPMTCACDGDLCFKCCGQRARDLGSEVIGIQVVKITSKFMNQAMKNMHGTKLKVIEPKLEDIFL